jgi:hypothetical protein
MIVRDDDKGWMMDDSLLSVNPQNKISSHKIQSNKKDKRFIQKSKTKRA